MTVAKKPWWRSLTIKLIAIYVAISVVGIWLVGAAMRHAFREGFEDNVTPHLRQYVRYVQRDLGDPPQLDNARRLAAQLPLEIYFKGKHGEWSTDDRPFPPLDEIHFSQRSRNAPIRWGHRGGEEIAMLRRGHSILLFVQPDDDDDWRPMMLLPLVLVVGFFALLYTLTRRLFAPLTAIRGAVNDFGEGDLAQRVAVKRRDELGEIAQSFNTMADRIQQMLESKRQLLLAISHELRSPLTRAKLATALLPNESQRLEIDAELGEMEALIAELLETERFNAGHQVLHLQSVDLGQLLQSVCDSFGDVIAFDDCAGEITIEADPTRLRLVVKNVLENALRHTPTDRAPPKLTLAQHGQRVTIVVSDHGKGIAPEHIAHLTEPFYRVDPARQRATGGYGLGLYLSRVIVEAHGGDLTIESIQGSGTTISLSLPLMRP